MSSHKALGKIVWWSKRDENGILQDARGNEYYFDRSGILASQKSKLSKDSVVLFIPTRCGATLAAKSISLPKAKSVDKYRVQFLQECAQLSFPQAF